MDRKHTGPAPWIDAAVHLSFELRQRGGRQRFFASDGQAVQLDLAAGQTVADSDILTDVGRCYFLQVAAAVEALSYVHCTDQLTLNRICYDFGRRGVPIQVGADAVVYRQDPDLDAAAVDFGARPQPCDCAFYPESMIASASPSAETSAVTVRTPKASAVGHELRQVSG